MRNTSEPLFSDQVRLLYTHSTTPMTVSVVVAALLAWSQRSLIDHAVLYSWFGVFVLISAARITLAHRFASRSRIADHDDMVCWHNRFLVGTYAIAAVWGGASVLLFPDNDPVHQMIFIVIIAGMAAGAVSSLCPSLPAIAGFLSLMLVPLALKMLVHRYEDAFIVGLLVMVYWAVSLINAIKINRDIHENIQLRFKNVEREKVLRASEERYRHIFHNVPLGIFQYNAASVIIDCNEAFARILGSTREKLIGFNMLASVKERRMLGTIKDSLTVGTGYFEGDYDSVTSDKTTPVRVFLTAVRSSDQAIIGGVGIVEDFTEKKLSEQQIQYHTTYDSLTGLPNRRLLLHQLNNEISRARRHGRYGALLFIDLDNFKTINDALGHAVGDELLKILSHRLAENIRQEDCAARMGGDEFIIILTELDNTIERAADEARVAAENIRAQLSAPCLIEGREMHITPSIGVSLFPKSALSGDDILKQADTAMYRAKAAGRNEIRFFLPDMQKAADDRLRLNTEIRAALERNELVLFYQPQVDESGAIIGAEALLRWQHPERGLLAPGAFLPVVEETGIMGDIDRWVLRAACRHIRLWADANLLKDAQIISVNISGREFTTPDFVATVQAILDETDAPPGHLGIELTESSLISTSGDTIEKIMALRQMGIKFSVDDFGTGYSSLSYLKSLPLHTLKIDRTFVNDIKDARQDIVLIDTIIMMAHNLGLEVIAEGVETGQELRYLTARGCRYYQGYYFSKPSPLSAFTEMLAAGRLSGASVVS